MASSDTCTYYIADNTTAGSTTYTIDTSAWAAISSCTATTTDTFYFSSSSYDWKPPAPPTKKEIAARKRRERARRKKENEARWALPALQKACQGFGRFGARHLVEGQMVPLNAPKDHVREIMDPGSIRKPRVAIERWGGLGNREV